MNEFAHELGPRPKYVDVQQAMAFGARSVLQWAYRFCEIDADDVHAEKRSDDESSILLCKRVAESTYNDFLGPLLEMEDVYRTESGIPRKGLSRQQWIEIESNYIQHLTGELRTELTRVLSAEPFELTEGDVKRRVEACLSQVDHIVHMVVNPFSLED